MPENKGMVSNNIIEKGGESLEIVLDDSEKNEYKIMMPLSYDFIFSPVDENGKGINVSSITNRDTRTIINVPGNAPQWKLKVIKPKDRSHMDGQGNTSPPTGDEEGDRFVDWLNTKAGKMDKTTKKRIHDAKREIVIRKEEIQ